MKSQKNSIRTSLEEYDPQIRRLGRDRYLSGKQIFNSKTHRLQPRYSQLSEVQRRELLLCGQLWAKKDGKEMRLYAREKKLLAKIFKDGTNIAITLLAGFLFAATLVDLDDDGFADFVQFMVGGQFVLKLVK